MPKIFNTNGYCDPQLHYMVDLTECLEQIKAMVDAEMYFAINRARQYGKTTVLTVLAPGGGGSVMKNLFSKAR